MSERFLQLALLADRGRISELGSGFRGKGARLEMGDLVLWGLALVGVVVAAWMTSQLLARREGRGACNNPRSLFRALCKAHGLDRGQRRLLRQLARSHRMVHPASVFLQPLKFDAGAVPPALADRAEAIRGLRRKLFGDTA